GRRRRLRFSHRLRDLHAADAAGRAAGHARRRRRSGPRPRAGPRRHSAPGRDRHPGRRARRRHRLPARRHGDARGAHRRRPHHRGRRDRRRLGAPAGGEAGRPGDRSGHPGRGRGTRRDLHPPVPRSRGARRPRRADHADRSGGDRQRGQLLRWRRRAGGRRLRDLGGGLRGHRLRPGREQRRHPRRPHVRRRARIPAAQLPSRIGLHGRRRLEPPRPAARLHRRRGIAEDQRPDRPRGPARGPRRAVPRHRVRARQAAQVPAARLRRRRQPLPSPLRAHRLLPAPHGGLSVRLDAGHGRLGGRPALRAVLRQRRLPPRLVPRDGLPPAGSPGGERLPRLRPRDPQAPALPRARGAPREPRGDARGDRGPGRRGPQDGGVPRGAV
ncbi:MAG: Undecaprenyl-phosphate alpha-N-acetylglucosaminyl 1-phosphate transferase, partial [uncultured Solirubrobacteraceae bacterium]